MKKSRQNEISLQFPHFFFFFKLKLNINYCWRQNSKYLTLLTSCKMKEDEKKKGYFHPVLGSY